MRDLVKLYEESFKLIIDNPNLTTDKIPNHLLEAWLSDDVIVITNTEQSYFAVSIFHLVHDVYLCLKGIETDPDSKTIERRFNTFQYIWLWSPYTVSILSIYIRFRLETLTIMALHLYLTQCQRISENSWL
mgnify:CR=1 FL=1